MILQGKGSLMRFFFFIHNRLATLNMSVDENKDLVYFSIIDILCSLNILKDQTLKL